MPYCGKRFWTRQIPTSCLPTLLIFIHIEHIKQWWSTIATISINKMNCELMLTYDTPALWQTGSRNPTGQKTLPTIWGTYMKLVTKYQISAINSCWEKSDITKLIDTLSQRLPCQKIDIKNLEANLQFSNCLFIDIFAK
jgi:hypothetical protein